MAAADPEDSGSASAWVPFTLNSRFVRARLGPTGISIHTVAHRLAGLHCADCFHAWPAHGVQASMVGISVTRGSAVHDRHLAFPTVEGR